MLITLVDSLRCPHPHRETWLVARCDRMIERDIVAGALVCPACERQYEIRDGAVLFDPPAAAGSPVRPDEHEAMRIAAFLELTDAPGFAVLEGGWCAHAALVSAIAPTHLLLLNPLEATPAQPGLSVVYSSARAPLAASSARAVAITAAAPPGCAESLRPGGRLLGSIDAAVPADVQELARDERAWIGQRAEQPAVATIERRR